MKTTIDIPGDILEDVLRYSQKSTKKDAVIVAMREYVDRRRMAELAPRLGTFEGIIPGKDLIRLRKKS